MCLRFHNVFFSFADFSFSTATADFEQKDGDSVMQEAKNVHGDLQANGDFIFSHDTLTNRKMVRTSNSGVFLKAGYLPLPATNWKNSESWIKKFNYRLNNLFRVQGIMNYIYFLYHYNIVLLQCPDDNIPNM